MDSLPWPAITAASGGWILAFLYTVAVMRGWLRTAPDVASIEAAHVRELERVERAAEREVEDANHERSEWRTEARLKDQTIAELNAQNLAMLHEIGQTQADFLASLRALADARTNQGGQGGEKP